jgi:hypothetical protein
MAMFSYEFHGLKDLMINQLEDLFTMPRIG